MSEIVCMRFEEDWLRIIEDYARDRGMGRSEFLRMVFVHNIQDFECLTERERKYFKQMEREHQINMDKAIAKHHLRSATFLSWSRALVGEMEMGGAKKEDIVAWMRSTLPIAKAYGKGKEFKDLIVAYQTGELFAGNRHGRRA